MATLQRTAKALAVNPLKISQPIGASLAFLGLSRTMPLMHGSQGCTAFGKVFLVRHFREPIPLQTTAMDHTAAIMGADQNITEALQTIAEKNHPDVIGLITTGLSETHGSDIHRIVKEFRTACPQWDGVAIVPVNTPDYLGCLESGYALAVDAMIRVLVPKSHKVGNRPKQINVLASSMLTPGDIETLKEWIEAFGLRPIVLPDLGDSLDGHLMPGEYSPLTLGGTPKAEIATLGEAAATLVIGPSLLRAAERLHEQTAVPHYHFDHLMGLEACDRFTQVLSEISGRAVPEKIERHRAQLQDAMVDTHFMLGFARIALAGEPDWLGGITSLLLSMGSEIVAAVTPIATRALEKLPMAKILVGDLEDLEKHASEAQLLIANSHAVETASRLQIPLLRAGFPQYDWVGGYTRTWIGYRGSRQTLFDLANFLLGQHHETTPYRSIYWQDTPRASEAVLSEVATGLGH